MPGLYRDRRKLVTTAAVISPGEPTPTSSHPGATQPTITTKTREIDRNLTGAAGTSTAVDRKKTSVILGGLYGTRAGVVVTDENSGRGGIGVRSLPDDLFQLQQQQQQQQQRQSGRVAVMPQDRPPNDCDDDEEEHRDNWGGLPLPAVNGVDKCRHQATSPRASTRNPALTAQKGHHLGDYQYDEGFLGCTGSHGEQHATSIDDRGLTSSSSNGSSGKMTSTGTVAAGRLQQKIGRVNNTASGVSNACVALDDDGNFGALRVPADAAAADFNDHQAGGGDLHGMMMNINGIAAGEEVGRAREAAVAMNGVGGFD